MPMRKPPASATEGFLTNPYPADEPKEKLNQ